MRPWELPYEQRFAGRKPRICIGFVAYGDIYPEVFESCFHWAIQVGARYNDRFEIFSAIATKREQYRARNALITEASLLGADFILMVDDDHTLMDCPRMIEHFYEERKPFQGGLYVQRRGDTLVPVIQTHDPETGICRWAQWGEFNQDGGPVDILGGGLNWFDCSLFDFMKEPFFWPTGGDNPVVFQPHMKYGLDMYFSVQIKERLGIQPWLNGKVKVGHVVAERAVVRPPGMNAHRICEGCDKVAAWNPALSRYECACGGE